MASEEHLVNGARKATGDDDIAVAGIFLPRGFVGRTVLGASLGGTVGGNLLGQIGEAVGGAAGAAGGMASAGREHGVRLIVAVSPRHVHVLHPEGLGGTSAERLSLIHTFDRTRLQVEVKARVTIRILVLEDTDSDSRIELEGSRAYFKHANDVIHALVIDGHGDVPVEGAGEVAATTG